MTEQKIIITRYENQPQWDRIDVKGKFAEWSFETYNDGDLGIECYTDVNGTECLLLNQEDIKRLIEFLQSKIK
jgi:hypothetical protein